MPLSLENLDDRTYADLVEEARSRTPALDPEWTNHNPSDPGITLLELLAWRTEMLVYRTNQVPPENTLAFLKLLQGPGWELPAGETLAEASRRTVLGLRERYRAVTPDDFEYLATAGFDEWRAGFRAAEHAEALRPCRLAADHAEAAALAPEQAHQPPDDACPFCLAGAECPTLSAMAGLADWWQRTGLAHRALNLPSRMSAARARCVPLRDLEQRRLERRTRTLPGHVSLVVVPGPHARLEAAGQALADALWTWLDERRTLTTHHHVLLPRYAPVRLRALVVLGRDTPTLAEAASVAGVQLADANPEALSAADADALRREWSHLGAVSPRQRLASVLQGFFDPVRGGRDGTGWPFGRGVYLSELYELLERQDIVEYVATLQVAPGDRGARLMWNRDGEVYGMALGPETDDRQGAALQLMPALAMDPTDVVVCDRTVRVEVVVDLPPPPAEMPDDVLAQVEGAMHLAVKGLFPPFGGTGGPEPVIPDDTAPEAAPLLRRALAAIFEPPEEMQRGLAAPRTVGEDDVRVALSGAPEGFAPTAVAFRADAERLSVDGRRRQRVSFRAREMAEVRVTLRRQEAKP